MKKMMFTLMSLLLCMMMVLTACGGDTTTTAAGGGTTTTPAPGGTTTTTTTQDGGTTTTTWWAPPVQGTTTQKPGGSDPVTLTEFSLSVNTNGKKVKVTGRDTVSAAAGGATMNSSASSLEFTVILTSASDVKVETTSTSDLWFTVYIDGVRQAKRVNFKSSAKVQTVATALAKGTHTIRLVRETEAGKGAFVVSKLHFAGVFGAKPVNKDLYIEFVGDSITCGTGNLHGYLNASDLATILANKTGACVGGSGDNNPTTEQDASNSYAFLTAEALGADASLVCQTGIGLQNGWNPTTMRDYYKRVAGGANYDFTTARKPDVVVINLGTNDFMCGADTGLFKQAVKDFIEEIRTYYNDPDLKIVWVAGMMNQSMQATAQEAINELSDANIYMKLDLPANREGHNGHPLYPTHQAAATALADFIRNTVLAD